MEGDFHRVVKKTLAKKPACYVLITCDEPEDDGHMQVRLSYEGDADLASYLLQGAQSFLDEECDRDDDEAERNPSVFASS